MMYCRHLDIIYQLVQDRIHLILGETVEGSLGTDVLGAFMYWLCKELRGINKR